MQASHPKYSAGQVWKYRTRPAEAASLATILRVDSAPTTGYIVHVALDDLSIKSPQNRGGIARTISHLPFSEAAIDGSLTELVRTGPVPDFVEGYDTWREGFDEGNAGVWTVSIAEAVAAMEAVLSTNDAG